MMYAKHNMSNLTFPGFLFVFEGHAIGDLEINVHFCITHILEE